MSFDEAYFQSRGLSLDYISVSAKSGFEQEDGFNIYRYRET